MQDLTPYLPDLIEIAGPIALVFARCLGLVWTAPALGSVSIGWRIRFGLAVLMTVAIFPSIVGEKSATPFLVTSLPVELGVGALLGMSASLVIAGASQAGEVVGMQTGLSPAALLNPDFDEEMNPLGHLYGLMALGVFLSLDGPLTIVGSLVQSYQVIPIGGLSLSTETVDMAFGQVGWALGLAVKAAAPAAVALLAAGVALGLIGRAAPSLSLLSYSLPVRVAVGMLLALLGMTALAGVFASAWFEVGIRP